MDGTKILMVQINNCRDCPYIAAKVVYAEQMEERPICSKTGTDLYTGCEAIPIPNNCPLPDPVWAPVARKEFR